MNDEQDMNDATRPARAERSRSRSRHVRKGFTLIELIVVVTIIGILAGLAIVNVRFAQRKAREAALMDNLATMRKAIDNFYADKQRYPDRSERARAELHPQDPQDPITEQSDWEVVMDDPLAGRVTAASRSRRRPIRSHVATGRHRREERGRGNDARQCPVHEL